MSGTRAEAFVVGAESYNTGKPCKHGHLADRRTSDGHCRTCAAARGLTYAHTEHGKISRNKWRQDNIEICRQSEKKYRDANKDKISAYLYTRKLVEPLLLEDVEELKRIQTTCEGCLREFSEDLKATLDHKTPMKLGGTNHKDNLQLLCRSCNSSKGAKPYDEWSRLPKQGAAIRSAA